MQVLQFKKMSQCNFQETCSELKATVRLSFACPQREKKSHLIKDTLIIAILSVHIPKAQFIQNHQLLAVINPFLLHFQLYGFWKKKRPVFPYKMR